MTYPEPGPWVVDFHMVVGHAPSSGTGTSLRGVSADGVLRPMVMVLPLFGSN